MGVLAHGSAHARPSDQAPIDTIENISAQVSGRGEGKKMMFFLTHVLFFCELKPHTQFRNPTITPSGGKVTTSERRKEREKMPLVVDT